MSAGRSFTESLRGARNYLGGAFVAVLVAPVLPDIAVDILGDRAPAWLLRALAVLILLAACAGVYAWIRALERKWVMKHARNPGLHQVERCDVLVMGLGPKSRFRPISERREDDQEIPEYLVRWTHPSTVILVSTPQVKNVDEIRENLIKEKIRVEVVRLADAFNPEVALGEVSSEITKYLDHESLNGTKISVDITAGTVIMSLAMLRLALLVNAKAIYVWREGGPDGPQRSISFDPQNVLPNTS